MMPVARRDLLKTAAGLAAAGPLGAWRLAAAEAVDQRPAQAFGFADDRVPMNAANLCPMPSAISRAVARYADALDRDLSADNRRRIEAMKDDARRGIAGMLGVMPDEIAVVRNTSEANATVVTGLELGPGDEVLLWDQNHPSNGLAWDVRAKRAGFAVRRFSIPADATSIDEAVDTVCAQRRANTRVVSFTHISNVSGFALPAAAICQCLHRADPELFIHVDGAQTWGIRDTDLRAMDCDSFSGSAHKWFMGPRETGLLYVREDRQPDVAAGVVSIPWGGDVEPSVAGARRYEALGQRDDAALAALAETVAWHQALTPAGIEAKSSAIANRLRDALVDLHMPLVSPRHPDFRSNVIILAASDAARRQLPQRVFEASGIITAGTGGLRMSPHFYNTAEHVDRVVEGIHGLRSELGTG